MKRKLENLSFLLLGLGITIGVTALALQNSPTAIKWGTPIFQMLLNFSFMAGFANFAGLLGYSTSICLPVAGQLEIKKLTAIPVATEVEDNYVNTTSTHLRLEKQFS